MRASDGVIEPRIYGHRGSRLRSGENTLDSFRLALDEGAHGFETDVRRLADGTVTLFHPDFVEERPTETYTYASLSKLRPDVTRATELSTLPSATEVVFEIKGSGFESQLVEEVCQITSAVLASFDHRVVTELARIRESTGAPFNLGAIITGRMIGGAGYVRRLGADWFLPASSFVDEELVEEFTAEEIKVVPWVLNHEFQWRSFTEWGCYGFITDKPAEAASWLASTSGRPA